MITKQIFDTSYDHPEKGQSIPPPDSVTKKYASFDEWFISLKENQENKEADTVYHFIIQQLGSQSSVFAVSSNNVEFEKSTHAMPNREGYTLSKKEFGGAGDRVLQQAIFRRIEDLVNSKKLRLPPGIHRITVGLDNSEPLILTLS